MAWEVYRQDVFDDDTGPEGEGWEPFAARADVSTAFPARDWETTEVVHEIVWWRRKKPADETIFEEG
jgi:hypothetical protein